MKLFNLEDELPAKAYGMNLVFTPQVWEDFIIG